MIPAYDLRVTPDPDETSTLGSDVSEEAPNTYEVTVWFDLDGTLFVRPTKEKLQEYCRTKLNLTKTTIYFKNSDRTEDCYLIFKQRTADLFKFLLSQKNQDQKPRVRIGFITSGSYVAGDILPFLENEYGLEADSIQQCKFINAFQYGSESTPKGAKLLRLNHNESFFHKDEKVILVDDSLTHLFNVLSCGFVGIHADHSQNSSDTGAEYLYEVLNIVRGTLALSTSVATKNAAPKPSVI